MDYTSFLQEAKALLPKLQEVRRDLHSHPELGFDLPYTKELVINELRRIGLEPCEMGKSGIVAMVGTGKEERCILLRADMDALPLCEEAEVAYKSQNPGKMHACGHDMHTAMLLGAAKLLKDHEEEIPGRIKLLFQPAEEIFQGSKDMIDSGVLENPKVDAAIMLHVIAGTPMPSGAFIAPCEGGLTTTSCEQYHITVKGKGGHGAMPQLAIDPITCAAQIHLALQELSSRELDPKGYAVFTTGKFTAGEVSNVIPETAQMWGTIRTADTEGEVSDFLHTRMTEISRGIGQAMRCETEVSFFDFCPCMKVDDRLAKICVKALHKLGAQAVEEMIPTPQAGSEDFAFISHQVPSYGAYLVAGSSRDGFTVTQHNPKVRYDDSVLYVGSAAYALMAVDCLQSGI